VGGRGARGRVADSWTEAFAVRAQRRAHQGRVRRAALARRRAGLASQVNRTRRDPRTWDPGRPRARCPLAPGAWAELGAGETRDRSRVARVPRSARGRHAKSGRCRLPEAAGGAPRVASATAPGAGRHSSDFRDSLVGSERWRPRRGLSAFSESRPVSGTGAPCAAQGRPTEQRPALLVSRALGRPGTS
jgi:hypothetical protein